MFIRGSGSGQEAKRVDNSFYRGIVVKNNDPLKLNRVRIYIPELTNQPYDDWFEKYETFILKAPGTNCNPKTEKEKKVVTDFEDVAMFEEICKQIPWAEPCYPVLGESGNYRYFKDGKISTISDCNYEEGFQVIDDLSPTLQSGSFSPAFIYDNYDTSFNDRFSDPINNLSVKCNPYSYSYRPSKFVNESKGVFGIPEIGSKVWVFHNQGDLNFPVYFGVTKDLRELTLINDSDNKSMISAKYPNDFDN